MIKLNGKIVTGRGVATKTVKKQLPFFKDNIPESYLINGSINVDISPKTWEITNPDYSYKNVDWYGDGRTEDFNFVKMQLEFEGQKYDGYMYNPYNTKNPRTMIEVVAEFIPGIEYGKDIEVYLPKDRIKLVNIIN